MRSSDRRIAGMGLQLLVSTGLALFMLPNMPLFVNFIGTPPEPVERTVSYLSLRAISLALHSLALLLVLGLKSMDKASLALLIVTLNTGMNMVLDLSSYLSYLSLFRLGLQGVAEGYRISNVFYCALAVVAALHTLRIRRQECCLTSLNSETKPLFNVGGWTGIDSFVRNFFYFFVLQVLNYMGPNQYARFQLFQKLMWTALIPVLAIADGTSIRVGNYLKTDQARYRIPRLLMVSAFLGFCIIGVFGLLGLVAIDAMGFAFTSNPDVVHYCSIMFFWQIIPYVLFAVSTNLRGLFFGTGKTYYSRSSV